MNDENKLLKAVHSDLKVKFYLYGCRVLGLINKFVICHKFVNFLESGIYILLMNKLYQKMSLLLFNLCVDAKELILGNVIFRENVEIP